MRNPSILSANCYHASCFELQTNESPSPINFLFSTASPLRPTVGPSFPLPYFSPTVFAALPLSIGPAKISLSHFRPSPMTFISTSFYAIFLAGAKHTLIEVDSEVLASRSRSLLKSGSSPVSLICRLLLESSPGFAISFFLALARRTLFSCPEVSTVCFPLDLFPLRPFRRNRRSSARLPLLPLSSSVL